MKRISIIIPTWNEASVIAQSIHGLRAQLPFELIVVDGGSTDETVALARQADRVLTSEPGRAMQMNAGAIESQGEILLFLHADCRLENGALLEMQRIMARPGILAGCFSMRVEATGWDYRLVDACASARVRWTGLIYGDQGLFLRRNDFFNLGGFPPLRFMEDVFFSRRLCQQGRIAVLPKKIYVSPRRWQKVGLVQQTVRNWALTALALTGVSPDRLAAYYPLIR